MALTDVRIHKSYKGKPGAQEVLISFKGPASYAQYGETMTAAQIGLPWILGGIAAAGCNSSGNATHLAVFYTCGVRGEGCKTGKWIISQYTDGAEVTATTDLSGVTFTSVMHGG